MTELIVKGEGAEAQGQLSRHDSDFDRVWAERTLMLTSPLRRRSLVTNVHRQAHLPWAECRGGRSRSRDKTRNSLFPWEARRAIRKDSSNSPRSRDFVHESRAKCFARVKSLKSLQGRSYAYFKDEETEAQRDQRTCPRSHK